MGDDTEEARLQCGKWYSLGKQFQELETRWKSKEIQDKLTPKQKIVIDECLFKTNSNLTSTTFSMNSFIAAVAFFEVMLEAVTKAKTRMDCRFTNFMLELQELNKKMVDEEQKNALLKEIGVKVS